MVFFKSLRKKFSHSKALAGFFKPQLLPLETRVNPVTIQGEVGLVGGNLSITLTSTGVGQDSNQVSISNTVGNIILVDALGNDAQGNANKLNLQSVTGSNIQINQISASQYSINFNSTPLTQLTLNGSYGQDVFTLNALNSTGAPLQTAQDFGISVDSTKYGNNFIFDSLIIQGEVGTKGAGNFITVSSSSNSLNLNSVTLESTGKIFSQGSGSVTLVANALSTSNIVFNLNGMVQTNSGNVNLTATDVTGKIQLAGTAISTNGGTINFNTSVQLAGDTTLSTGLSANGNVNFNGTVDGPPLSFSPQSTFQLGTSPEFIVLGDVNNDGILDLVSPNGGSNNTSVLLGNGNGTFKNQNTFLAGLSPEGVSLADLNNDNILDMAVSNQGNLISSGGVSILLGNGDGTFKNQSIFQTGIDSEMVQIGDLDGDNIPDLVVANRGSNNISVLIGNGDGTFKNQVTYGTGSNPLYVVLDDINNDGNLDSITANSGSNSVSVLLGNGDGTFKTQVTFGVGTGPRAVVTGDVNGM